MLAIAEPSKLFLLDATMQPPLLGQSSVPLAAYSIAFTVVVFLRVAELLLMIGTGLTCTERLGNRKHGLLFEKASLRGKRCVFKLSVLICSLLSDRRCFWHTI